MAQNVTLVVLKPITNKYCVKTKLYTSSTFLHTSVLHTHSHFFRSQAKGIRDWKDDTKELHDRKPQANP